MKFIIFLSLTFSMLLSNAQKFEKFYDYTWKECEPNSARFYSVIIKTDSGYTRKDYFIHESSLQMSGKYEDDSCKIPNGQFYYFHPNNNLQSFGKYVHGKKDGLWMSFYNNSTMMDSTTYVLGESSGISLSWHPNGYLKDSTNVKDDGSSVEVTWFENGNPSSAGMYLSSKKKYGKWKYYHANGNISSEEVYDNGALINKKIYSEDGKPQLDTANHDHEAKFQIGKKSWQDYLYNQAYFPSQFKIVNGDRAVVVVSFSVNEEGKVGDVVVSTPFYPQFDKIAENAILKSPNWTPAISHNRKIKSWLRQPVVFTQE